MDDLSAATSTNAVAPAKSHYAVLDGLRGVAALMVVLFHLFEAWAQNGVQRQLVAHGYLAVDFFFLLSGFVVAYAYDDRWGRLTQAGFYLRRLIRLQPMLVLGTLLGAAMLPFQHFALFPKLGSVSLGHVLLVMAMGVVMLPLPKAFDIRGWDESFPLNGPAWSLFYEYAANILYAAGLRRLPLRWLGALVAVAGAALVHLAVTSEHGDLIGGWSLDAAGIHIGLVRVLFPFFAGVLLMRSGRRIRSDHAFLRCSLLLILALSLPRIGGADRPWLNGLYEAGCVILLFPLIVAVGAGEKREQGRSIRVARFFGDLSYPLYITHYPLIYVFAGWIAAGGVGVGRAAAVGAATFAAALLVAWVSLKLYDEPVRRWLSARLLARGGLPADGGGQPGRP